MEKTHHDIVAELMADISSPSVVSAIDKALERNEQDRQELLELRKMAVRRHGEVSENIDLTLELTGLTVPELVHRYRTDPESGYHQLRFNTRENYESLMK